MNECKVKTKEEEMEEEVLRRRQALLYSDRISIIIQIKGSSMLVYDQSLSWSFSPSVRHTLIHTHTWVSLKQHVSRDCMLTEFSPFLPWKLKEGRAEVRPTNYLSAPLKLEKPKVSFCLDFLHITGKRQHGIVVARS